jgi:hypothetical protein
MALGLGLGAASVWTAVAEKRVAVVVPGRLYRGAWQRPWPLRRILAREKIRTVVTLTAINRDDPKYVSQAEVVRDLGVDWVIVPMRGSRATVQQMADASDLLADPQRQPVFFHCVAGHHRTSLVHAAYLVRHRNFSAEAAWRIVAALPWARPGAAADRDDHSLIESFAAAEHRRTRSAQSAEGLEHAHRSHSSLGPQVMPDPGAGRRQPSRLEPGDRQLRDRSRRPGLPLGTVARGRSEPHRP